MAAINDPLVTRKWEGSDIPASILEAGQLFSTRVRMTRATRQLWDEREKFLKYERGWDAEDDDDDIESLDLDELTLEEKEVLRELRAEDRAKREPPPPDNEVDFGPRPDKLSGRDKQRLMAVETFYVGFISSFGLLWINPLTDLARCFASPAIFGDCSSPSYSR